MTEVREKYSALAAEVSALRQIVDTLTKTNSDKATLKPNTARSVTHPKRSYARATRAAHSSATTKLSATATSKATPSVGTATRQPRVETPHDERTVEPKSKVKVNGARRIWGTLPTCSAGAIAATISKLVPAKLQLRIRRKTKMLANNKVLWWFIVHGAESDLVVLERDWDKVQVQTLWSLQNCYMPSNTAQPENNTSTLDLHTTHVQSPPHTSPEGAQPEHITVSETDPQTSNEHQTSEVETNTTLEASINNDKSTHASSFQNTPHTPPNT